jgi:hypothetical protein
MKLPTDKKNIKISLIISALALLFFGLSFGPIFLKNLTNPNPPETDNGLGMAFMIFAPPVLLTLLQLVFCSLTLYFKRHTQVIPALIIAIATILTIPIIIFGFVMFAFCLLVLSIH